MYHFIDLTSDEITLRRLILNKYGFVAQLSALSLLILVALGAWLLPAPQRVPVPKLPSATDPDAAQGETDAVEMTPQVRAGGPRERSPSARGLSRRSEDAGGGREAAEGSGEERVGLMAGEEERDRPLGQEERVDAPPDILVSSGESSMQKRGRVGAWLDRPVREGWRETRRQVLCTALWGGWLLVLVFRETGEDYLHLTKRFAHVAAALLPFHYLLGTSTRLSPLPFLFRAPLSSSYNAYHRLHGVLMLTLLALHTCFYLNFYFWKGWGWVFGTRVVILGLCMAATLAVLATMSRENVRKTWRPAFVWTHVLGAGALLVMLWFHVGIARWYVVEAGAVYVAGLYERILRWRKNRPKH